MTGRMTWPSRLISNSHVTGTAWAAQAVPGVGGGGRSRRAAISGATACFKRTDQRLTTNEKFVSVREWMATQPSA
jgi:hypothetical protein